jgi:transcriptional regulator with XRE-family HTH domain
MAEANPTVRQRELSTRLRKLREDKKLAIGQVADLLMCSVTKVSRMETGARRVSLRDVRDLCQIYEVSQPEAAQLMDLARRAREDGWWAHYDDLGVGPYLDLEQEAKAITYYSMSFVNGLLQTNDYARAIIRAINPQMDDQVLKERVEARIRRQELLERPDRPRVRVLMDEAVLHRQTGGRKVMGAQLSKMLDFITKEKVIVQIVPFSSGAPASSDSNFTLFEFSDSSVPSILHVEGLISAQYLDRETAVDRYREVLDHLRDAALPPRGSQDLITEIRDAHERDALL